MTQTSLDDLLNQSYDLCAAYGRALDATAADWPGPGKPELWFDLKISYDAANTAAAQLYQVIKRQREASEPVPYTVPDDLDLPF